MNVFFKDTSYAWLQFNDCITGRGFALKLGYKNKSDDKIISSAFTQFDPKFSIDPELVAYTDKGSVFVENMQTGKKAIMPFDKMYEIDYRKLHETVDSINITKTRVFAKMIRDGKEKVYEKNVSL